MENKKLGVGGGANFFKRIGDIKPMWHFLLPEREASVAKQHIRSLPWLLIKDGSP